jgi:NADPH:quinone reductase-like Zn-dependent oxidoreductase
MRAVVYDRYGPPDVQRLAEAARPVSKDDEVLIKIRATTVTRTDCGPRSAEYFISRFVTGLRRPQQQILGLEFAGEVEGAGAAVTTLAVGDRVFGAKGYGAHAEFICMGQDAALAWMPAGVSFEEAAVCDAAALALACLSPAILHEDRSILIYGASGSVGAAGAQLAKSFGANVTGVCSGKNVELVRALGADRVIDYTRGDFTRDGETDDVIFDAVGKISFRRCRRALKPGGAYCETDLGLLWHVPILAMVTRRIGDKRVILGTTRYTQADVIFLEELIEAGKYRAVVDRVYPLEQVVEASRYVETGHKVGNVVTVGGKGDSSAKATPEMRESEEHCETDAL